MSKFAHKDKKNLDIRRRVEKILANVEPGDYASEVLSIYYWVCQNIRYLRDITDIEFLKQPYVTMQTKSGDCDDIACLIAAMLLSCGNQCRFVMIDISGSKPPRYSHVLAQAKTPKGNWITLDPVAGKNTAQMVRRTTAHKAFIV